MCSIGRFPYAGLHLVRSLLNRMTQSRQRTDDKNDENTDTARYTKTRTDTRTLTRTCTEKKNQRTEEQKLFLPADI